MKLITLVWIGFGGALGSIGRAYVNHLIPSIFPWSTLIVNIVGSLILGAIVGYDMNNDRLQSTVKGFLVIGFCGGFTTFSTFSFQALQQLEKKLFHEAAFSIITTVVGTILAVWIGIKLGKSLYEL